MDLKLKDKVAVVTGAGSQIGYGKNIALTLAEEGCDIIIGDIDIEGAGKTAAGVEARGRKAMVAKVNVTDRAEVNAMVEAGIQTMGKIDILVNNAGASSRMMPFLEMTKKEWEFDIGVNLYGQMNMAQAVLPHMISRKYGRVINTAGGQGIPTLSLYGAAKGAIVQWTRALAKEVAGSGVIVTYYSPGLGATGLTADDPRMADLAKISPMGRLCIPEDIGPLVAFLASDISAYYAMMLAGTTPG
ncbi:MAG: SDR family oxidoreductase [Dehalococcoidales bacterium]|nr:SDR family oxidoreductase [Dehalococcoidales bacterium]